MSIKASNWVGLINKRKEIFAQLQSPISMKEICDKTGHTYGTVNNHMTKLLDLGFVKYFGQAKYGSHTRDLYIALADDYEPPMPDYVSQYLNVEVEKLEAINKPKTGNRVVSCDDYHTRGYTEKRSVWTASSLQGF